MPQSVEVTLTAELTFSSPVDHESLAALDAVVQRTRLEHGCRDYTAHLHADDPRRVFIHERWADQAALDRHWASEHLAEFREFVATRLAEAPRLIFWRRLG